MKYLVIRLQSGLAHGLLGEYYSVRDPDTLAADEAPSVVRVDHCIDFVWFDSPFGGSSAMDFIVRWKGYLRIEEEGYYVFFMECDDGCVLTLDGRALINGWREQPPTLYFSNPIYMVKGSYEVVVNYFNVGPFGLVKLGWVTPSGTVSTIPSASLFTKRGDTVVVKGLKPGTIVELWNSKPVASDEVNEYGLALLRLDARRPLDCFFRIVSNGVEFNSPIIRDVWGGDVFEVKEL